MRDPVTDALIAAFLARGGRIGRCPEKRALNVPPTPQRASADAKEDYMLSRYAHTFNELLSNSDAPQYGPDWWAAYDIGPADPWRPIAEAGALVVICRDEGAESARLYHQECCALAPER